MSTSQPHDVDEPYRDLCRGMGVAVLDDWSSITVMGADRQKFLQNFCTNDVKRLAPGEACEAFFLNVKGKIVGHGLVTCRDDALVIVGPPGHATQLAGQLERYILREDVQLRDSTEERAFLVSGTMIDITPESFAWNLIGVGTSRVFETAASELANVARMLPGRGLKLVDRPAFETARIEAGVPLFGIDFDAENLPQEVGRDRQAISFTKGCYLGQETVARIDSLGHVNRRIVGVRFLGNEKPLAGAELTQSGTTVGRVTSVTISPQLAAPLALAMVRREANAAGTRLESAVGECEVIELPLPRA